MKYFLGRPFVYDLFQKIIGGDSARKRFVREFIPLAPGSRILDIGCGPASLLEYLPRDIEYVGVDENESYIEYARGKYKNHIFHRAGLDEQLPFESAGFDVVTATGVLHHLNDAQGKKLCEIAARSLKPGGYFVTNDNAYVPEQSRLARYIISQDRGEYVRAPEQYKALAAPFFSAVDSVVLHDLLRIPYTHFVMKCSKRAG